MTTEEFAKLSGVSVTAISRFERNESDTMASTLRRIELAFGSQGIEFVETQDGRRGLLYKAELDDADLEALEGKRKR